VDLRQTPVVVLCGGMGTRLREETEYRPKPMVEIGGRPILWHIMKGYASHGFCNFVLCLGYKGDIIKNYFLNYEAMNSDVTIELGRPQTVQVHTRHDEGSWRVTLVDTGVESMTGARVKKAAPYLDGAEFMLTYGDGVANIDINELLRFHRSCGTIGTVTGVHPPSRFGELLTNGERVVEFNEKPLGHHGTINGGFFVFQRRFLDYLSYSADCVLEAEPLERLSRENQLSVFRHPGFWQCMDTYRDHQYLKRLWEDGDARWKTW
jgi:glucose-1-phosphate cytidylyltransferase